MSKESGVPNYALQNRCKPTEIKLSKPLVHFFFLKPKAQKMKIESQAILLQLVLTAKHRQLLRNHQLWFAKRKTPFGEFRSLR
ncbi:MAG: hypothetical protein IJW79_01655 [Clostridia bacterium]|nr:hypothetical protein [Clostridia bacterium]